MKTIKITDNLFLIIVPKYISYFDIEHEIMDKKKCSLRLYNSADWQIPLIPLEYAIHKIHGLITTPELMFDFDFEVNDSWVNLWSITRLEQFGYKNYLSSTNDNLVFDLSSKRESFRTRIQKAIQGAGMLLLNPYKKPDNYELWQKYGSFTQYGESLSIHSQRWKESESKVVKGNLLLIEKIN